MVVTEEISIGYMVTEIKKLIPLAHGYLNGSVWALDAGEYIQRLDEYLVGIELTRDYLSERIKELNEIIEKRNSTKALVPI